MMGVLGWNWHQLDHMKTICTSLQTDNHTNTRHSISTGRMLFLTPNQQRQSTEAKVKCGKVKRSQVKQVCVQLPTSADNVALPACAGARRAAADRRPCSNRSTSRGRRTCISKADEAACGGWTDGQTHRRTLDSYIDPAVHTVPMNRAFA